MELNRLTPPTEEHIGTTTQGWIPPPKGCLKLNVDVSYKDNKAALVVLVRDDMGRVQGLWFEKAHFSSVLEAEAKQIFNPYAIAKEKIIIKF